MKKQLDLSKQLQWIVHIRTKHPDGDTYDGIVLEDRRSFIIVQEFSDFEADGILVLPKKWIKGVRNGPAEQCKNDIVRQTGARAAVRATDWCQDLTTLREIVTYLKAQDIWPAIEVIFDHKSAFYVGPITDVSRTTFKIYCYDSAGTWEKEYELDYREVFKVEIDSRYVRHFNAYMRQRGGPG